MAPTLSVLSWAPPAVGRGSWSRGDGYSLPATPVIG